MSFPLTSTLFVGRDNELAQIGALFSNPACRLLTLVGPGGIGKTRLALEAARQFSHPENACFVPLQPLTSSDFIVSAIADALGFQFYGGAEPKQQLLDYLRDKAWLLVLDNFEQMLDGAPLLSEILTAASAVRLLVTSRERLNLVEEWVLEVGGLAYPTSDSDSALEGYSAVELFIQHASRVKAGFTLTAANRLAVLRICRMVGGMPLGIELAAAWVRALSCEAIADEISRSLDILETPARNVEPRHRTMRAAIEPTWVRLSEAERAVFMRLSVFRGGFTREAAEQVAGASLRTLSALVDKSLLRVDASGRYDLHELLRQYAADKLSADETSTTADRHLNYFLKLAKQVEAHQYGTENKFWLDRVEVELDNIRMALDWSLSSESVESGLCINVALRSFWDYRNHQLEGFTWSERLLAIAQEVSPSVRAKALEHAGDQALDIGQKERAKTLGTEALTLARQINDPSTIAWALAVLGRLSLDLRRPIEAVEPLEESLALFRTLDDAYGLSHTLRRRAMIAVYLEDYDYARRLSEESLLRDRAAGDKNATAWSLLILGDVIYFLGHNAKEVTPLLEESASLFLELGNGEGAHMPLIRLASIERLTGQFPRAQAHYEQALAIAPDAWAFTGGWFAYTLAGLALLPNLQGNPERAAHLLGALEKFIPAFDAPPFCPAEMITQRERSLRDQMGESAYQTAWTEGYAMTTKEVIAYALQHESPPPASLPRRVASQPLIDPLTDREMEVLCLIADGLNNGEIAAQLVLAPTTVKWYVRQIFSKLDATSRTQAVARARALGLLGSAT